MTKQLTRSDLEAAFGRLMLERLRDQENPMLGVKRLPGDTRQGGRRREDFGLLVSLARSVVGSKGFTTADVSEALGIDKNTAYRVIFKMKSEATLEELGVDPETYRKTWRVVNPSTRGSSVLDRTKEFIRGWKADTFISADICEVYSTNNVTANRMIKIAGVLGLVEDSGDRIGRSGREIVWQIVKRP